MMKSNTGCHGTLEVPDNRLLKGINDWLIRAPHIAERVPVLQASPLCRCCAVANGRLHKQ
jgi:hypothetical protein